jgi:serine/threonine protein kinase
MAGSRHTRINNISSVVGVHYKVGRKIGEGSFGIIHEGIKSKNPSSPFHISTFLYILTLFRTKGLNLMNNKQVAIKFESRKSEAPQLKDEYRTYKILAGTSKIIIFFFFTLRYLGSTLFFFFRWDSNCLLFWPRRYTQYSRSRYFGTKFRGSIWYVLKKVFYKNSGHACQTNGNS